MATRGPINFTSIADRIQEKLDIAKINVASIVIEEEWDNFLSSEEYQEYIAPSTEEPVPTRTRNSSRGSKRKSKFPESALLQLGDNKSYPQFSFEHLLQIESRNKFGKKFLDTLRDSGVMSDSEYASLLPEVDKTYEHKKDAGTLYVRLYNHFMAAGGEENHFNSDIINPERLPPRDPLEVRLMEYYLFPSFDRNGDALKAPQSGSSIFQNAIGYRKIWRAIQFLSAIELYKQTRQDYGDAEAVKFFFLDVYSEHMSVEALDRYYDTAEEWQVRFLQEKIWDPIVKIWTDEVEEVVVNWDKIGSKTMLTKLKEGDEMGLLEVKEQIQDAVMVIYEAAKYALVREDDVLKEYPKLMFESHEHQDQFGGEFAKVYNGLKSFKLLAIPNMKVTDTTQRFRMQCLEQGLLIVDHVIANPISNKDLYRSIMTDLDWAEESTTTEVVLQEEWVDVVRFLHLCHKIMHFDDVVSKGPKAFFDLITPANMKLLYQVAKDDKVNDEPRMAEKHLSGLNKIQLVEAMAMKTMDRQVVEEDEDNIAEQYAIDMSRRRRMRTITNPGASRMRTIATTATAARRLKTKTTTSIERMRPTRSLVTKTPQKKRTTDKKTSARCRNRRAVPPASQEVFWC
mmetsp:Transcript_1571/g.2155  ORF Transcript_1571/g.2155 Transcript_1571/m.2155 type:complete len:624 (+) Transcript_1571:276-2147(+)|eukprot:CAMPEP_0178921628 /NCGR_PEP_ID=MMETSP0786-20121207/15673_1 /TAXON_ID=186022 /ORGANISM="Thalassionema frauenfeldii, Strain CCMP 1798" /LENGTH=623 /DNA_ID=CAMNT_0020595841 /DNA_START=170 /DNA_END=2041 /DNA_ORIENTATION=+